MGPALSRVCCYLPLTVASRGHELRLPQNFSLSGEGDTQWASNVEELGEVKGNMSVGGMSTDRGGSVHLL